MLMSDDSRRETLTRYWQGRPLNQTCPSGVFRVGSVETGVREHQVLPYRVSLPLPIFKPTELGIRLGRGAPHTLEDLPPAHAPNGACLDKRPVEQITKDLPPIKPMRMEFAKAPRDLGRSMSQEAQRGWKGRKRRRAESGWWTKECMDFIKNEMNIHVILRDWAGTKNLAIASRFSKVKTQMKVKIRR